MPTERVVLYTSAPASYDGFSTTEVSADMGRDNRGMVVRLVVLEPRDLGWQAGRYGSGMHAYATPKEAARFPTIWQISESALSEINARRLPLAEKASRDELSDEEAREFASLQEGYFAALRARLGDHKPIGVTEQQLADIWNRNNPTGVIVDVRRGDDEVMRTRTCSHARVITGIAVVKAEASGFYHPLSQVTRVPFVSDEDFEYQRAAGECLCDACGKPYREHPDDLDHPSYDGLPGLVKLCDGRLVKL